MTLCNKHFIAELFLELIMVIAPASLDYLGAVGEFILKLDQPAISSIRDATDSEISSSEYSLIVF